MRIFGVIPIIKLQTVPKQQTDSDVLTTICHLAIVNVCMIIILSIGNTQISILLLCFLYLFVELMITMNDLVFIFVFV